MSVRMLSRPAPSTANSSNKNSALTIPLPASTTAFPLSIPLSSSSPPGTPAPSPVPEPPEVKRPLSSPPLSPASTLGGPSPYFPPAAHPSASCSISSSSSRGAGTTGITLPSPSSPGTNGVVVVGVIGKVGHEVSGLLNRLLDSHVFGVKSRTWEQWHGSGPEVLSTPNGGGRIIRERNQKDGHRLWDSDSQEDGVLGGCRIDDNVGSVRNDFGANRGTGSEKGHFGNSRSDRPREGQAQGHRSEKVHVASRESDMKKKGPVESTSWGGGDGESGKTWDDWMEAKRNVPLLLRKLKYHHDDEKGMLYVQFTWGEPPLDYFKGDSLDVAVPGRLSTFLEQHEADGMRGLLFMFSVCHVILLVQEGAGFDPRFLRMLRLLQAAKQSLIPFVKTQVLPGLLPPPSSASKTSLMNPIPPLASHASGRSGIVGRNSSTIALMSGSTPVLFPGQCIPVVLFVCLEDLGDSTMGFSHETTLSEDIPEMSISTVFQVGSLLSQSGNYLPRQILHVKPESPASTVMRISSRSDAGLRKKLQSSVETQIRFLLKKCRTGAGSGDLGPLGNGMGPGMGFRGQGGSVNTFQGVGGGVPLFVLDPSRAAILLDRSAIWQTNALDYAVCGMETRVLGNQGVEDVQWDLGLNAGTSGEDIQAVKEFISRQAEILRGKGGLSSNAAGGAAGVGVVAAAAAAAAASAASGGLGGTSKAISNPPELPSFSNWLSACQVMAEALSVRPAENTKPDALDKFSHETCIVTKKGIGGPIMSGSTGNIIRTRGTIDSALLGLESASNVDMKFSTAWCKRVLVTAQDTYLMGLPPSYSTNYHKSQLEKSLRVLHSMARGPAVPLYAEKLRKKCEAVWHCGRQLCDAESLTGKPCIHQVHEVMDAVPTNLKSNRTKSHTQDTGKGACKKHMSRPHSSGVVFLHACACGRSRKLRKDPFDFESANVSFFKFPNCENLLPSLIISSPLEDLPSGDSPWSLVCLGDSCYYQPAVGLVQSGFCSKQNFLSLWDIPIVYRSVEAQSRTIAAFPDEKVAGLPCCEGRPSLATEIAPKSILPSVQPAWKLGGVRNILHTKVAKKDCSDGTGPSSSIRCNFECSKSRTGASLATRENSGSESAFPPLLQKMDKPTKLYFGVERKCSSSDLVEHEDTNHSVLLNNAAENNHKQCRPARYTKGYWLSNMKDIDNCGSNVSSNSVTQHFQLYVGFEHECPHGHRFLLSQDQCEKPGSSNSSLVAGVRKQENDNLVQPSKHEKQGQNCSNSRNAVSLKRTWDATHVHQESWENATEFFHIFSSKLAQKGTKIAADGLQHGSVQDGYGDGRSLLNSNLPIYMHCPHCKLSEEKKSNKGMVFGGTISQLQRIFLVTPSLPLQLASCPVVEFEDVSRPGRTTMKFNEGREVVLPPDSFLSLRLPFVYYSQLEGSPHKPLVVKQNHPEHCAWLVKNTAIYFLSNGGINRPWGD